MAQLLFLRGARQLLTLRGPDGLRRGTHLHDLGVIEDGSVLIRDRAIEAVGTTRRIENLKEVRSALEIPAGGMVVMPGFVDSNIQFNLDKSIATRGRPAKRKKLADFYSESLAVLRSCLQYGTLNAAIKATAGTTDWRTDIPVIRRLAEIGNNPVGVVRAWRVSWPSRAETEAILDDFEETLAYLVHRKLIKFLELESDGQQDVPERVWKAVSKHGLGVSLLWPGGSPRLLRNLLSMFRPMKTCLPPSLSGEECALLSTIPGAVVFSIGKEALANDGTNSMRELLNDGAAIALSSGYDSTSSPTFSMQMVVALAVLRLGLSTEAAITASTINAAHALGLGHSLGSLEAGKQADVLVLNIEDYRDLPGRFGTNHVGMVIREGNIAFNRTRWKVSAS